MRHRPKKFVEKYRVVDGSYRSPRGANYGAFQVGRMRILICDGTEGMNWEHVSVSFPDRTPTWVEMCMVKDTFWGSEETVIQFHPSKSDYVNHHKYCLHLWKRTDSNFELPPNIAV